MKTDVILKFEQNFKNLTEKMKNTVKTHNTGLVNNLFCIIAYIVIISLSLVSCKEPEESPPAAKDMILVDISRNTDWDYMIAAKDGSCAIYNVDEETKIPTLIYYKPDKNLDMGYTILLKENGLPDRMIINGTVYYLSNFDGYKFDLAIISPNGDIEIYKGNDSIETDTNWDEYDKIEEYIHRSAFTFEEGLDAVDLGLQIAGHAIGIGSCILAFIPPVNLLGAVGCGTYIASTAASISIDQMEKAGYLESVHADSLNLLLDVGGCAGRDPVACASALTGTISLLMGLDLDASDELSQEIAAAYYELENNPLIRVRSVIISDTPDILDVGDTHTLKATVTPSNATYKNVIWTSSNPAVATVNNNGTITANSAGTAIITARTIDGGYAATYVATVDGITLDKETLNLIVSGPPGLLNATVYSYKGTHSITWTSSNPAVATVGSGTSNAINLGKTVNNNAVMAVSAGTAVITATAVINSNIAQLTFTISCTVTVTGGGGNNNGGNNASWTSPTGIKMMQINAGTYTRGIANDSMYRASPPHQVTLTKSFYMGKYLVTQDQYMEVMGYDPSQNTVGTPLPVDSVSWYDAVEFCNKLSLKENRTPVYTITGRTPASGYPIDSAAVTVNWNANGYRLPTEAEWEYACRAGTTTLYNTGDEITPEQANFSYSF
ncbi:MAG: SUMF1/EgtB/PvdO family nonheme iron enzyme, partial [Treponema sp.]|nr:SUMF1/EgtB/PvdO family nonheme iron enzyme [Treponema sp.]